VHASHARDGAQAETVKQDLEGSTQGADATVAVFAGSQCDDLDRNLGRREPT
jgi:hypothetical protein